MTIELHEYEGCFSFNITAETKDEVVQLARFGIGKLKELEYCDVHFLQKGNAVASIQIRKSKRNSTTL